LLGLVFLLYLDQCCHANLNARGAPHWAQVISHNHYDHLDEQSVTALAAMRPPPVFFVPLGMKVSGLFTEKS
jgi:metal-dependent hydrolase (beta-lactamase superfamily II)